MKHAHSRSSAVKHTSASRYRDADRRITDPARALRSTSLPRSIAATASNERPLQREFGDWRSVLAGHLVEAIDDERWHRSLVFMSVVDLFFDCSKNIFSTILMRDALPDYCYFCPRCRCRSGFSS